RTESILRDRNIGRLLRDRHHHVRVGDRCQKLSRSKDSTGNAKFVKLAFKEKIRSIPRADVESLIQESDGVGGLGTVRGVTRGRSAVNVNLNAIGAIQAAVNGDGIMMPGTVRGEIGIFDPVARWPAIA